MVPDRQKVRTDGRTDARAHRRRQNYIPPTSSGDNKYFLSLHKAAFYSGVPHGFEIWKNQRAVLVKCLFRLAQKINCKNSSAM